MARHLNNALALAALLATAAPALAQDQQQRLDDPEQAAYRPDLPRPAEISIYNAPKFPCAPQSGQPKTKLYVDINTCVSANFTLDNNVHLSYMGLCAGWSSHPYVAFYPTADCTGEYSHPRGWSGSGPGHCLSKAIWRDITPPEGQWSMSLRCDDAEALKTIKITLPEPPKKAEPKPKPRPSAASVSDSACYAPGMRGPPRFLFQRPEADVCVNVEANHELKIYRNALCPDGSEALQALEFGRREFSQMAGILS
ncbi:uncharacterized protein DNG_10067 [Cephalotrichum gorgonifer]|uniref:Uncharacterized protein n=1 Tax=Cephalotrichum gorgonifer TaxID=2041049 RepID=A0AAE8N8J4_9PEZI|nr:uncharacterized protein DNG_10067 [Cephalotrichum gorgonifer]